MTNQLPLKFTKDFTSPYVSSWKRWLDKFVGLPDIQGIEIGCFEGRSSLWFLENVLQSASSSLICIDPWCASEFCENIHNYRHKIRWLKSPSRLALRDPGFKQKSYHFAYIDGNHSAPAVLEDAILVFPLLVAGGILIFDDYGWKSSTPEAPQSMPRLAIDSFLEVYKEQVRLIEINWQVCIEKL